MAERTPDLRDRVRHVVYEPREPRTMRTPSGEATVSVGPGFDQVVVTLTPAAADELARVIGTSQRLEPGVEAEADPGTWMHVVLDLLSSSAACNPRAYPPARLVRLEGTAR